MEVQAWAVAEQSLKDKGITDYTDGDIIAEHALLMVLAEKEKLSVVAADAVLDDVVPDIEEDIPEEKPSIFKRKKK